MIVFMSAAEAGMGGGVLTDFAAAPSDTPASPAYVMGFVIAFVLVAIYLAVRYFRGRK
jgi:hypothetical protein